MTLPALIFAILLASLYGAVYHLVRGGGLARLILFVILGWAGFAAGHALASHFEWTFDSLGSLHLGSATVAALLFLVAGDWLSKIEIQRDKR